MNKITKLSIVMIFLFLLTAIKAQEAIISSGGDAFGTSGSMSYSFGQIIYTMNFGINGSINQGVQQPFEISIVSVLLHEKKDNLIASVFPNPTSDFLKIRIDNHYGLKCRFLIFNINGKLLMMQSIENDEAHINVRGMVSGTYFLVITEGNRNVSVFKIIKN